MKTTLQAHENVPAVEVHAAVERITTSPAFHSAPKLAAFLRFVVERALAGDSAHIKGYTVATEALGRDASFDPATDPIVRVEAGRLRRALARYYAGDGIDDPVIIELAPGSYVPQFCHRTVGQASPGIFGRLRNFSGAVGFRARPYLMPFGFLALGASLVAAIGFVIPRDLPPRQAPRYDGPVLYVEPITIIGKPGPDTISVASLHDHLVDALARFDDVNIVSGPAELVPGADVTGAVKDARSPDYRLTTMARYYRDRSASLMFRLLDVDDRTIVWSRSFDGLRPSSNTTAAKARVIRGVALPLLQPLGVIHARERIRLASADATANPYRCLLDSHEYLRSFDRTRYAPARACLEQAVASDPTFASGFVQLARVYLREHQFANNVQPGPPALERAYAMAERALALKPNSARAHFVLFDLDLARDDFTAAMPEGARAVALNPNDLPMIFHYGALLVLMGEVAKGEAIVREAAGEAAVPSARLNFILFVAAYLKGDLETAAYHARQVTGDPVGAGCLARALIATKTGDRAAFVREMECLRSQQSGWRTDPRALLKKLFPAPPVLDRIAADLLAMVAAGPN